MADHHSPSDELTRDQCRELAVAIDDLERRAHELGFGETAQQLNKAKNKCGWEAVYLLNKQRPEVPHD